MEIERLPEELGYAPGSGFSMVLKEDDTEEMYHIVRHLIPEWAKLFNEKNRKYAGLVKNDLGAKGKFVDVYRKTMLLKSRIWDDYPEIGEGNEEVIMDMIGHLFLMLHEIGEARRLEGE